MALNRHTELSTTVEALQQAGETNIITTLAAHSLTVLRRQISEATLTNREVLDTFLDTVEALIPEYYIEPELERQQKLFTEERQKMEHALVTGSSKGALVNGRTDSSGPNTYSPERQLLWHLAWNYMDHKEVAKGERRTPGTTVLKNELSDSPGMRWMRNEVAYLMESMLAMLGTASSQCEIRWGDADSYFYLAKKELHPELKNNLVNLDIYKTLLLGQQTIQIMLHEIGHHLYDTQYPKHLADVMEKLKEMEPGYKSGSLSEEERAEFKKLMVKQNIMHDLWNSGADNAVDEGSVTLSHHQNKKTTSTEYPKGLFPRIDAALLVNSYALRGVGHKYHEILEEGPQNPKKMEMMKKNPSARVQALCNTLFVVSQIKNGLVPNTLEGLHSIGIYPELFQHKDHKEEWGWEENWDYIYSRCRKLMELTPDPDFTSRAEWRKQRDAMQAERNEIHREIFEDYAAEPLEEILKNKEEFEKLLKKLKEKMGNGNQPVPGSGQPGSNAPEIIPGKGLGEGEPVTIKEGKEGHISGDGKEEPDNNGAGKETPKVGGNFGNTPAHGRAAGKASNALIDLPLGDGRTLAELQHDPQIKRAIAKLAEEIEKLYRQQRIASPGHTSKAHTLRAQGGRAAHVIDRDKIKLIERHGGERSVNDFKTFRKPAAVYNLPPVGDFMFEIDTSGSMGWGQNSAAEHCIKATALMVLAIQNVNKRLDRKGADAIGCYVGLWGNTEPTYLSKPYDKKGTEEMIQQFDKLLASVLAGERVHGVGGGTEMVGVAKTIAEEYGVNRPKNMREYHSQNLRGPCAVIIASDGAVYDIDSVPLATMMKDNPYTTYDCLLTKGNGSALHAAMINATNAGKPHQKPVCADITTDGAILVGLLDLVKQRVKSLARAFEQSHIFPTTNEQFARASQKNMQTLGMPIPRSAAHLTTRTEGNDFSR